MNGVVSGLGGVKRTEPPVWLRVLKLKLPNILSPAATQTPAPRAESASDVMVVMVIVLVHVGAADACPLNRDAPNPVTPATINPYFVIAVPPGCATSNGLRLLVALSAPHVSLRL
jgi:hypothetical protein